MEPVSFFERYRQLQRYVRWNDEDAARVDRLGRLIRPHFASLIDDFYSVIAEHPAARRVIVDGDRQIRELKKSLGIWLNDLFRGPYDHTYVHRRSRIGRRHVEIGLDQVYTNAAISRLRGRMADCLTRELADRPDELVACVMTLDKLLDLDLAIIENAYESEHVSRQKLAERARMAEVLHQERAFAEGLWEYAPAIVLVLDMQARIVRYNTYLQQLSGIPLEQVEGKDWIDVFVPQDQDQQQPLREAFDRTLREEVVSGTVTSMRSCGGRHRSISWSTKALKDVSGQPRAVLVVGQDITDLNEAQQRALQAERLAAIGQMSTGLAHESRNALQRIQACAEMLELEVEGNAEALNLVGRIKSAQDHMHRLFDEVRGYAAPMSLDRTELRLAAIWRDAWELLQSQWQGRDAELTETPAAGRANYCGDHFRLVQLFRILLENSLAACDDPCRIVIDCHDTVLGTSQALQVSVTDNGPGFSDQQREQAFQPFYTTKTKGTGLGLAIARRIADAHQGTLEIGSGDHPGAEIRITLPRSNGVER